MTAALPRNEEAIGQPSGQELHMLIEQLYPISRSITGEGVRQTLQILQQHVPLRIVEVPSGTAVFDWAVPQEWNVRDAYVKNERGDKVIDYADSNLHLLQYSIPVRATMPLQELRQHLFTLPEQPDLIPYKTSYYNATWGFCLEHNRLLTLEDGMYEVVIDVSLEDGSLTYGELLIPGETQEEVFFSCHVCHPSLCNDNLSGVAIATFLARELLKRKNRFTYRFVFVPATIGAITWLSQNKDKLPNIRHGAVLSLLGDEGSFTYKKTREGDFTIDKIMAHVLKHQEEPFRIIDFFPYGYDERQYCSPGINLPVGCFMRTPHGEFPEYHTSADNLDFVKPTLLQKSLEVLMQVVQVLEHNRTCINQSPKGEPQLGRRGLYSSLVGNKDRKSREMAMLWILNLSDGRYSLLDIAERANTPFVIMHEVALLLEEKGLLRQA